MFRDSAKGTGYPLHSPVSPSLPLPCVTVCHHISTALYLSTFTEDPAVSIFCARTMESVGASEEPLKQHRTEHTILENSSGKKYTKYKSKFVFTTRKR